MNKKQKPLRSFIASLVTAAMISSFAFAPALAGARESGQEIAPDVPEWAIDDGGSQGAQFQAQAALPQTYDLRSEDLVTPVKFQNPWQSCWAFGGTAAAETSILSAYGGLASKSKLDLSERHLTYFALQPVTADVDPDQVGEGLTPIATGSNAPFDAGGLPVFITSLYSQGVGPMLEELYPYHGNNGITTSADYEANPEHLEADTKEQIALLAASLGTDYDTYMAARAAAAGKTVDELLVEFEGYIKDAMTADPTYSKYDDWSIPATNPDGSSNRLVSNGVVLRNGNVLPEYWNADHSAVNQESKDAIKQEILNGRGVSIMYWAEQGTTYANQPGDGRTDQCQYVYEPLGIDHGVCIVGWDDGYKAENFTHGETAEEQEKTTPPADGAWIVKNSWGSESDATEENADDLGNIMNHKAWGTLNEKGEHTGYFYLSYFDKTIQQPESMEFSADLGESGSFATLQYDYLPASSGFYTQPATADVTSSANIFPADRDMTIKSVSTSTSEPNMRVTFAIYKLDDDATTPEDGTLVCRTSRNFEYGGFHRVDIDQPITIEKGQKFSVISTASVVDENGARQYSVSASRSVSKATAEYLRENGKKMAFYGTAVVNEGESFIFDQGEWKDWKGYLDQIPASAELTALVPDATKYTDVCPVDNFSIKVYADPAEVKSSTFDDVTSETYHADDIYWLADNKISEGWSEDGKTLFKPLDEVARADMAAFMFRLGKAWGIVDESWTPDEELKATFADVDAKTPHAKEIWWLASKGISTGWTEKNGTKTFRPLKPVARQDMAAFMFRLAKLTGRGGASDSWVASEPAKTAFVDVDGTDADNHHDEIWWLGDTGISKGYDMGDGTWKFRGLTTTKRCDMAAFLHRLDSLAPQSS